MSNINFYDLVDDGINESVSKEQEVYSDGLPNFSSLISDDDQTNLSSIDTTRKLSYGAAQETTIGGNLWRLAKTLTTDKTWEDLEKERQREIDKEYTEFIGLKDKEEDAAIITGRIGTAIADPVTWLIPWAKVAKAGKIASVAAGAGVGVGETVLRESMTKGEVSGTNVAIAGVAGSVGGYLNTILMKIPNKSKVVDALDDVAPEVNDIKPTVLSVTDSEVKEALSEVVEEAPLPPMRDIIKSYQRRHFYGEPEPIAVTSQSPMRDLVRAHNRRLSGYNQDMPEGQARIILSKEETKNLESVSNFVGSQTVTPEKIKSGVFTSEILDSLGKADKEIKEMTQLISNTMNKTKKETYEEKLVKLKSKRNSIVSGIGNRAIDLIEETENINIKALEKLSQEGKLTDNVMRAIMQETARPVLGAAGGFVSGASNMEDSDDYGTLLAHTAVGLGIGYGWKNINNSKTLTELEKSKANKILINNSKTHMGRALKGWFGSSIPTVLKADGGWNKVIGKLMYSVSGDATDSLEARMLREQSEYLNKLNNIYGDSIEDKTVSVLVGESLRGFIDPTQLKVGYSGLNNSLEGVTKEQIAEVGRILPLVQQARDDIANRVSSSGIRYKVQDDYGLAQRYNLDKLDSDDARSAFKADMAEALRIQNKGESVNSSQLDRIVNGIEGERPLKGAKDVAGDSNSIFVKKEDGTFKMRRLSDFFEKNRMITDRDAVKYLAEKGWLNLDSMEVLTDYGFQSLKLSNFANTLGPNGELVNFALDASDDAFNKAGKTDLGTAYRERLINAVEVFWGGYGKKMSDGSNSALTLLTTAANTSYLTGVTITSLAELAQPMMNSGFKAAFQGAKGKITGNKNFSQMTSFKHDQSFERELTALMKTSNKARVNKFDAVNEQVNNLFFKTIQLQRLTETARNYAYDTGVNRAYNIAKKYTKSGKLNQAVVKEIETLGLSVNDLKRIGSYDDIKVAFNKDNAQDILDIAGRRAADRDAIVPLMGNRLYFSQTNNPVVRAFGQFLSWSQAKSVQMNAFADRVESGEAKALIRTIATVPIGAAVIELKGLFDTDYAERGKKESFALRDLGNYMRSTGNFENWAQTKGQDLIEYGLRDGDLASQGVPAYAWLKDFAKAAGDANEDLNNEDTKGAIKEILDELPGFKQALKAYKGMTGEYIIYDAPNVKDKEKLPTLRKGGEVDIERTAAEPDERIDKMTGMPYDQQAGTAFVDEEDPLRRMGFGRGGGVDPLRRLGFGQGGKVLNVLQNRKVSNV